MMVSNESLSYVDGIRNKLNKYIAETKKSQSQISKELGVSKTTLSMFLTNSYSGNNQDIAEKVEQYLQMGAVRKELAKEPGICLNLTNTEMILEKTRIAHISNDILLIYGAAGCGKTTALKHYAKNTNGAIYVEADVTTNSHRSILMLLLEAIGEESHGSTSSIMRFLVSKLKGTNQLIIIDEAQHLTPKSFDALRALNDKANIGIVYSGNPSVLKRMYGTKEEEFDQVHSRIGYHCELHNRYSFNDIAIVFSQFNISKECLQYLHKVAQRKGGLRIMIKQYKLAANIANALNEDISVTHLDDAAKRMGIGGIPV